VDEEDATKLPAADGGRYKKIKRRVKKAQRHKAAATQRKMASGRKVTGKNVAGMSEC
jgi:hypothetical protein